MKLLNKSILWLSLSLFFVIGLWMIVFYFNIRKEIKSSIDEGLEHYKREIIYKAQMHPRILKQHRFDEGFYDVKKISESEAIGFKDIYKDDIMELQDADDQAPEPEPVRMLITVFEVDGDYYELRIFNSMIEEDDLVKELFFDAIWLYLILILCIVVINNFVLKRLWQPFYQLLQQLKNFRFEQSKSYPKIKTNTNEFNDLDQAINVLLDYTSETFDKQKQFIGNASHELQTPLAIITNKLELLTESNSFSDQDGEKIGEIMAIVERLVRLNKSLLLLTKIENKQFLDNQQVSFQKVIEPMIQNLEEIADFKEVSLHLTVENDFIVEIDITLANIIISNLLRNAIFHNTPSGKVEVIISADGFTVKNTGDEETLDESQIFSRFYKSTKKQNSSGLGLAIVKAICELYSLQISYRYEDKLHVFKIS